MVENIQSVLVAGSSGEEIKPLLPFARVIAGATNNRVSILGLVPVPAHTSLSAGALNARRLREELEARARRPSERIIIRVAHNIWRELTETAAHEGCALVLLNSINIPPRDFLVAIPSNLAVVKPPLTRKIRRILLPIRGGPYAALGLRIALAFAKVYQAEITVLRVAAPEYRSTRSYQELLAHLSELPQVTRWIDASGDPVAAILAATRRHQLIVMGSLATPRPDGPAIGLTSSRVLNEAAIPALFVRAAASPDTTTVPAPGIEPVDYTISVVVDKWFAENTFHAREFQNIKELVQLKERQGLTISLGLPTLNEEKTIGPIVRMMRKKFVERFPLLDEIVVIDSDSTDRTVEIASDLGVRVVRHSQILPEYGSRVGKGEALWKSLYELSGELVAWIDTDIVNIHPRFVYGILGPLITNPDLMYVKGFYQRPLRFGKKFEARGGGRVTELSARPLLNLFYPNLSGFVQPLSGEYAGRRWALERVPFFTGYGVEIGLLIDLWSKFTLAAIGQVDLEERIHRNQSLIELSKMAFEIVQAVMQRVGEERQVELVNELNKSMKLIRYARDEFQLDVADIRTYVRPPMIQVAEYRRLRGIANGK